MFFSLFSEKWLSLILNWTLSKQLFVAPKHFFFFHMLTRLCCCFILHWLHRHCSTSYLLYTDMGHYTSLYLSCLMTLFLSCFQLLLVSERYQTYCHFVARHKCFVSSFLTKSLVFIFIKSIQCFISSMVPLQILIYFTSLNPSCICYHHN